MGVKVITGETQEQREKKRLAQDINEFFVPSTRFGGKEIPPPTELAAELAGRWLAGEGKAGAIRVLSQKIDTLLMNRAGMKGRLDWDEVDVLCSQALELYLKLADESGLDWEKRDAVILTRLTKIFWQLPDRIVESLEEPTNCTSYLGNSPCMLKSKELIFSWVVGRWNLNSSFEPERGNIKAAFDFICAVLNQGRSSGQKTHPDNIRVLKNHERSEFSGLASLPGWEPHVDESRVLLKEDEKLFLAILKDHCHSAKLKELRPWVRDDLPEKLLEIFQKALLESSERSVVVQLLRGETAAAA